MITKFPVIITLVGILSGLIISLMFGANEDYFKNKIVKGLEKNQKIQQMKNLEEKESKLTIEADKNWRYYQRFHFHSLGINTLSLLLLILSSKLILTSLEYKLASYSVSISGLIYPFFWLILGIYGPEMGRKEAKQAFGFVGFSGIVFVVGTCFILYLLIRKPFKSEYAGSKL